MKAKNSMELVTPTKLRQYFLEYVVIGLTGAVITLFLMFNDLNKYIRNTQDETLNKVSKSLDNSTNSINQFLSTQKYK
jgi:ATP-dependent protease HslVU (ClpYQ) peptidase subunit